MLLITCNLKVSFLKLQILYLEWLEKQQFNEEI